MLQGQSMFYIIIIIIIIKRIFIQEKHFNNYNIAVITVCPVSQTLNEIKRKCITLKILKRWLNLTRMKSIKPKLYIEIR